MLQETKLQPTEKEIIESYKLTFSRCNYTLWERRIIYNILRAEDIQTPIKGKITDKKDGIVRNIDTIFGDLQITMPYSLITNDPNEYHLVKNALKKLLERTFYYEDTKGNFYGTTFIMKPTFSKSSGKVDFIIDRAVYEMLTDISKGYRRYNLGVIMSLKSIYAMRFYEMFCYQENEHTYKISELREMFMLEKKYSTNNRFIEKVVETAKNELDRVANYSFEYIPIKSEGSRAYDHIHFIVKHIVENESNICDDLKLNREKNDISKVGRLSYQLYNILQDSFEFTEDEINVNKATFFIAEQSSILEYGKNSGTSYLIEDIDKYQKKGIEKNIDNIKGYIIGCVKRKANILTEELKQKKLKYINSKINN